jgi:hypothetical protein
MGYINPDLLSDLLSEDLGPIDEVMLVSDMTIEAASKLWLRNAFLKKFEDRESPDAHTLAVEKFLSYNNKCAQFVLEPKQLYDDLVINGVIDLLDDWLHPKGMPVGLAEIARLGELGPGSSAKTDSTAFYTKLFDSGLSTANEDLRVLYREAVRGHPTWSQAEMARESNWGNRTVTGSFTSTVPKQFDIKRTICTEPVLEMFFQRGIGNVIEEIMEKRLGLTLKTQPDLNRNFARIGSIDGSFGTIDLRSASDSISMSLVKRVFPRYFVDWLVRTRSHVTTLPDGREVELHMVSSMGNGFTFALQTMLFASIVVTCYRLKGISPRFCRRRNSKGAYEPNCGVFGDDIVVLREVYEHVSHCLTLFGFEVNDGKSFNSGNFRESCGEDWFRGVNIRGIYLKNLTTEQDCFSAVNRLVRWSVLHGINLDLCISYLLGSVSFLPIPFRDGDDEGVKVPWTHAKVSYFSRFTRSPLYRARVSLPSSFPVPSDAGQLNEKAYQRLPYKLAYNGAGILLAFVAGFVRDGRITVRSDRKRSKVRLREVPCWDYLASAGSLGDSEESPLFDYQDDEAWSASVGNLFNRIGYPGVA